MNQSEQKANSKLHSPFIARTLTFIRHDNQFLMIKGSPDKHTWPNLYNAIGGHIEKGESIINSAYREISEETGLTKKHIYDLRFVGVITIALPKDSPDIILFIFSGSSTTTNVKESNEGTLHWLTLNEILNIPTVEDIPVLIDQVLKANDTDSTFIGHYWYDANNKLQITFLEQGKS